VEKTVYIKNNGNAPITKNMSYSDWSPTEAGDYISLTWNQEGTQLTADAVVQAVLTLSISDTITGITEFSFNILIEGTG